MHRLAIASVIVAASIGVVSSVPDTTAMHLRLTKSEPAADSSVTQLTAIKLWFSQHVELGVTQVRLTAGEGNRNIELAALAKASREVDVPVVAGIPGTVAPGRYTVHWRTMSRDGHPVSGTFAFTYSAAGTPTGNH